MLSIMKPLPASILALHSNAIDVDCVNKLFSGIDCVIVGVISKITTSELLTQVSPPLSLQFNSYLQASPTVKFALSKVISYSVLFVVAIPEKLNWVILSFNQ